MRACGQIKEEMQPLGYAFSWKGKGTNRVEHRHVVGCLFSFLNTRLSLWGTQCFSDAFQWTTVPALAEALSGGSRLFLDTQKQSQWCRSPCAIPILLQACASCWAVLSDTACNINDGSCSASTELCPDTVVQNTFISKQLEESLLYWQIKINRRRQL